MVLLSSATPLVFATSIYTAGGMRGLSKVLPGASWEFALVPSQRSINICLFILNGGIDTVGLQIDINSFRTFLISENHNPMDHIRSHLPPRKLKDSSYGFTLIELLMVFAVISILAAITFGITGGVKNAQNRAKAKAELAVISQAIEEYKARHGDYPWVSDDPVLLVQSLLGWTRLENTGSGLGMGIKGEDEVPDSGPDPFLDITKFEVSGTMPSDETAMPTDLSILDPWGQAYVYSYKTSSSGNWENFGYVLYSPGPDGEHAGVPDDGIITNAIRKDEENLDNIYPGQ